MKRVIRKCVLTVYLEVTDRMMSKLQENLRCHLSTEHIFTVASCFAPNDINYFTLQYQASTKQRQRARFHILSLPLPNSSVRSSPLIQLSPLSFFFRSLWVFIFFLVLGGSNSKLIRLWQKNPSSVVCPTHFHVRSLICSVTSCCVLHFEITLG